MINATAKLGGYLKSDPSFARIYDYARERFDAAPHLTAHNFEHARRDVLNAIVIGEAEGADMQVVLPAMVMHDIGFLYGATGKTHGEIGAKKLMEFLARGQIEIPAHMQPSIAECIRTHKGVTHGVEPQSHEAKVVADADLLDKFGPVGVYQAILVFSEFHLTPGEIIRRLQSRTDLPFFTKTGEKLAASLREYPEQFGRDLAAAYAPYHEDSE